MEAKIKRQKVNDEIEKRTERNREAYSIKNRENVETVNISVQTPKGKMKNKKIERVTFKNGVVKNKLIEVI